jgi:hypothetical protein
MDSKRAQRDSNDAVHARGRLFLGHPSVSVVVILFLLLSLQGHKRV